MSRYVNRTMTITGTCGNITATFEATVAETCVNEDCDNCCSQRANSNTGYLVDMEYYTFVRHFGSNTLCANGLHNIYFKMEMNTSVTIDATKTAV
jgi:hypothetical protein